MTKERLNSTIKYTAISVGIAIVSMPVIFFAVFLFIVAPPEPSVAKMERELIKNKEMIMIVVDSFEKSGSETIYITDTELEKISNKWIEKDVELDDKCYEAMLQLVKKGYGVFLKKGETVEFQRWSTLDCSSGIAYTPDGSEPEISDLSFLKPLSEPGWYYYFASRE